METQKLTDHEMKKINKQIAGIEMSLDYLNWDRNQIKFAILNEIPKQSKRINVPEKEINLDYSMIPDEFKNAIIVSRLNRKIHIFYNLQFQGNLLLSKEIGRYISDLYNSINHIFNLIVFANPSRFHGRTIADDLQSLKRNKEVLNGNLLKVIENNEQWIKEFKDMRKIDEHKSPMEFYITFNVRKDNSKVRFLMNNNYSNDKYDIFSILNYLDLIIRLFNDVKNEVNLILKEGYSKKSIT